MLSDDPCPFSWGYDHVTPCDLCYLWFNALATALDEPQLQVSCLDLCKKQNQYGHPAWYGTISKMSGFSEARTKGSSLMSGLKRSNWSCRMPASVAGYLKLNCEVSFLKLDQSKLARVSKSCFKMFQDVSRCFKMFQDVSRCFKAKQLQNSKDQPRTQGIPLGHSAAKSSLSGCEDSPECHRAIISSHLTGRPTMSHVTSTPHDTSRHVRTGQWEGQTDDIRYVVSSPVLQWVPDVCWLSS